MLLRNKTKTTGPSRKVMFISLVLIGSMAVYNWFVAPHRNYVLAAQRYEAITGELEKKNEILSSTVTNKRKGLEEIQEEFLLGRSKLFDSASAKEFFDSIHAISKASNCIFETLTLSQAKSATMQKGSKSSSRITTHSATLAVLGSYSNISKLMNKLQDRPEMVSIDSVSIAPKRKNYVQLKCNMTITVYVIHK